ncbi:hypothetical protein [Nannocystis pusilla]|uniref:hypothetical protein n=1 Tax=Nannocystis pusilla TaxID=889268 RepID=UPI003DA22F5B
MSTRPRPLSLLLLGALTSSACQGGDGSTDGSTGAATDATAATAQPATERHEHRSDRRPRRSHHPDELDDLDLRPDDLDLGQHHRRGDDHEHRSPRHRN